MVNNLKCQILNLHLLVFEVDEARVTKVKAKIPAIACVRLDTPGGWTWFSKLIFFAYFYTLNVSFKPEDVAENIKKQGGFVPGIRPGPKTAEYLEYVIVRVLVVGSLYLAAVCLLPEVLRAQMNVPFYFGGTSVLIVVSVTLDTVAQLQSHLLAYQYEGLIEKSRLGRKNKKQSRFRR